MGRVNVETISATERRETALNHYNVKRIRRNGKEHRRQGTADAECAVDYSKLFYGFNAGRQARHRDLRKQNVP